MSDNAELKKSSYLYGPNSTYIAEMYELYEQSPGNVPEEWHDFFKELGDDVANIDKDFKGGKWASGRSAVIGQLDEEEKAARAARGPVPEGEGSASALSIKAHQVIRAYRVRGHLMAKLDPLGLTTLPGHPELDYQHYGFTEDDLDTEIYLGGWMSFESATLRELLKALQQTYCGTLGIEYAHITSLEQREWIERVIEGNVGKPEISKDAKKKILKSMIDTQGFEEFLHKKYPGTKRFSIEGAEAAIPALETVLETAAGLGVNEIVLGMPHRGRLNVLTTFMGKSYAKMLSEFQGAMAHPEDLGVSGDVKYHLGTSSDRNLDGKNVHLSLTANPSHLEAVNPVVVGKVRAKQDQKGDAEREQVMGLLLHGDAAFAGQGVVAETLALSDLEGYTTGGTVHLIVNNQIGFTTSPHKARKSPYPTDVAKIVQAPIFHVNGDDPEAVVYAAQLAAEFRQQFKKDVVIDLFCYRRFGHNEGDEPNFTQPMMYQAIDDHPTPREVYGKKLVDEGVISEDEFDQLKQDQYDFLDGEFEAAKSYKENKADWLEGKWVGFEKPDGGIKENTKTGVAVKTLKEIGLKLIDIPEDVTIHKKLERLMKQKKEMIEAGKNIDWAMAEQLAFGTLLTEGIPVRLSGQDSGRGTFSHRHSVLRDQKTGEDYLPLNHLSEDQGRYEVIDSNLSEFAVLGFEYGYSLAEPKTLTLWEAQFGDFVNGAQIMIDQFITSAEVKWLRMSGLVMLLPHGYEGQGPEHSSARLERFLQSCAEDNIQVANITTPANYFHALRRQIVRNFRKPLIIMTPKSLLRHKLAVSELDYMKEDTHFRRVIPEHVKLVANDKVRKVVLCSGKVYYDLLQQREEKKINDVALVRVEQYYPFPKDELKQELKKYKNADVIWCQEEPQNMGAWDFIDPRIEDVLKEIKHSCNRPGYVGRRSAASPAAGYMKLHTAEQQELVSVALG